MAWYHQGHKLALDVARALHFLHSHEVRARLNLPHNFTLGKYMKVPCEERPSGSAHICCSGAACQKERLSGCL